MNYGHFDNVTPEIQLIFQNRLITKSLFFKFGFKDSHIVRKI